MFNSLMRRYNDFEKMNEAVEEKAQRLKEQVQIKSSKLKKMSEDLATEKSLHDETKKALEKALKDLEDAKAATAEAQDWQQIAEGQCLELAEEINGKNREIEKIYSKAKSSEEKYEQLVSTMLVEKEQNKSLSKEMYEVTSKLDKMTLDFGSKAKKRNFGEEDIRAAVKWTASSLDVLPKIVRGFSGYCFAAGAQCLAASLERDKCTHIQNLMKGSLLCSAKDLQKPSAMVDTIEKRVLSSCWEKGWVEDCMRNRIAALREEVICLCSSFEDLSFVFYASECLPLIMFYRLKRSGKPKQLLRLLPKNQKHLRRATPSRIIFPSTKKVSPPCIFPLLHKLLSFELF